MKKVWVLLLVLATIHISCEKDTSSCDSQQYFDIIGLRAGSKYVKRNTAGVELGEEALLDLDSVRLDQFFLEGYLEANYYAAAKPAFSFLPQALATSPCPNPGFNGSQEKLGSFDLISLGNFSSRFPAGSSLNPVVLINDLPAATYISQNAEKIKHQFLKITLTEKPTNRKEYQAFKIIYSLQNGETYEVQTARFKLL